MGFFGEIISSVVKVAVTPLAVVKDAVSVVSGDEPVATKNLINSAVEDAKNSIDSLSDGDL